MSLPVSRRATLKGGAVATLLAAHGNGDAAEMVGTPVPGWDSFVDAIRTLPERMLARLPEAQRGDPQVQQEVARLALEAIASQTLGALAGDGDHPQFVATIGQVLNVGQPNADSIYRAATITPGGVYRLQGERGSLRKAFISEVGTRAKEATQGSAHRAVHDLNALRVNDKGRFDVILSVERPRDHKGDWWQLAPPTNMLLMRLVSGDWAKEREPTISIERIDVPPQRPRPSAASLEARLRTLPQTINFLGLLFVERHEQIRREGLINKLKLVDLSLAGGLAGQYYYEGAYDLADDEALIIEAKAPRRCGYRSLILTNPLYETTDWVNNHSSLNDAQAPLDPDGVLRIVVSARDPGVPNWLDTAGYPRGVIQGRWMDCDSQPVPSVRKVLVSAVRQHLPPETGTVTPAQREQIIRARRAALLERPLW